MATQVRDLTAPTTPPRTTLGDASPAAGLQTSASSTRFAPIGWAVVRLIAGWMFLWAFLDKLFGLGFATPGERAWINGGSPTKGFLSNSAAGPFADFYRGIAGAPWADVLFMAGLLAIGTALILGVGMRIAAVSGAVLYLMMFTVALPPATNPIVDDHVLGAAVLIGLALANAGDTFGFGSRWARTSLVKRAAWLR